MENKVVAKAGSRRWIGYTIVLVLVASAGLILYTLLEISHSATNIISNVSGVIASRSGLSIWFVKGAVTILSIGYFIAWAKLLKTAWDAISGFGAPNFDPLYLYRNKWGWIIVTYTGVFYMVVGWASKDALAYKNCAETPAGLYVTDNTGTDPVYRQQLTPCSLEQIERARAGKTATGPRPLTAAQVKQRGFFNESGFAQIWYAAGEDGSYQFFDRGGVDSQGDTLKPVTRAIVTDWSHQQRHLVAQQQSARAQQQQAQHQAQTQQELAANAEHAQQQYEAGAFEQALDSCRTVLAAQPGNESCRDVEHDASAKLARQLVDKGQTELQRGQLEDAARNASRALRLDPDNGQAKTLQTVAHNLISSSNR